MAAIAADRDLLFGLLALQNGLIDQAPARRRLPGLDPRQGPAAGRPPGRPGRPRRRAARAASRRWSRCTSRSTAATPSRAWPPSPPAAPPARAWPRLGDPELEAHPRPASAPASTEPTATPTAPPATPSARPPPTASGSASSGPTPGAAWAPSSSPSTPSCTARWRSSRSSTSTPTTRPAAQRFLLEAEITGGLEHPGIVPVYGLGTYADGRPYYAMRFIRGDSLKEAIDRFHADEALEERPRPPLAGAAQAAAAVHRRLQRDRLRPQPRACCTATSSRATSSSASTARRWWSTGGWPRPIGRAEPGAAADERTLVPVVGQRHRRDAARAARWARRPT